MVPICLPIFLFLFSVSVAASIMDNNSDNSKFIKSFAEISLLKSYISNYIALRSEESITHNGKFVIALSGGSMPTLLSDLAERSDMQWDKIYVLFADERCKCSSAAVYKFFIFLFFMFGLVQVVPWMMLIVISKHVKMLSSTKSPSPERTSSPLRTTPTLTTPPSYMKTDCSMCSVTAPSTWCCWGWGLMATQPVSSRATSCSSTQGTEMWYQYLTPRSLPVVASL